MRDTAGIRPWVFFFSSCSCDLCVCFCVTPSVARQFWCRDFIGIQQLTVRPPQDPGPSACVRPSLSPWLPCMMLAEAKQTLFFFFFFGVFTSAQREGRFKARWGGKTRETTAAEESKRGGMGRDKFSPALSENPKRSNYDLYQGSTALRVCIICEHQSYITWPRRPVKI